MGTTPSSRKAALLETLRMRIITQAIVPGFDLDGTSFNEI
jgi:hypothetical protein